MLFLLQIWPPHCKVLIIPQENLIVLWHLTNEWQLLSKAYLKSFLFICHLFPVPKSAA